MKTLILIFVLFITTCLYSTIITVPNDQPTIQAGIDAAVNADTVLVQTGTYFENINYNGKNITVASLFLTTQDTTYISATIIDGNNDGSVVTFWGVDNLAKLVGFTITNGIYDGGGGGIYCYEASPNLLNLNITGNLGSNGSSGGGIHISWYSSPTIQNVTISENSATGSGGGISCDYFSSPELINVSISNNYATFDGGGIICLDTSPSLTDVIITSNSANQGGGFVCAGDDSSPNLVHVLISDNSAVSYGGGMICGSESYPNFADVTITGNSAYENGGGIYFCNDSSPSFSIEDRCNIYSNTAGNTRGCGADIFVEECDVLDIIVDTFTVMTPTDYYASPIDNFTFDILHCVVDSLINADVYISIDGNNSNSGISPDLPFRTINHALSMIYSDSLNINTIHLASGIYSNTTNGELFPIKWSNFTNLSGSGEEVTILDAEESSVVMDFKIVTNSIIDNITITGGGHAPGPYGKGGGIYCDNSNPILQNVTLIDNSSSYKGGGISCHSSSPSLENVVITGNVATDGGGIYCDENSSPNLLNVTITNNSSSYKGGGISCHGSNPSLENVAITGNFATNGGGISCLGSNPSLENVVITGNVATDGGGIYCDNSNPILQNVTIINNSSSYKGSGIYFYNGSSPNFSIENRCNIYSNTIGNFRGFGADIFAEECDTINIVVDTFTVMTPTDYYASPIDNFTFNILHSVVDSLINADVYVSIDGNNSNSGMSPDLPFRTINHALSMLYFDSLNINTIHLASGVYSNSTNGEQFPLFWSSYVNLSGSSEDETILDAEESSVVIDFNDVTDAIINNITITNGNAQSGGGIYCSYSSPSLVNVTISSNNANSMGGGIYCDNSSLSLVNVTISTNSAASKGGGIFCWDSSPSLENVTISGNSTAIYGSGIYCGSNYWSSSNPNLINSILWNDLPHEISFSNAGGPNSITISYSDIQGGEAGIVTNNNSTVNWLEGNIDEDPLFVGTGEDPYSLLEYSPCIDTGIVDTTGLNLPPWDIIGNLRIWDGDGNGSAVIDMGAYEYGSPPYVDIEDNVIVQTPEVFLHQNYPNPFNPTTTINYSLKENSEVSLNIYNIKGQKIKSLLSDQLSAGQHSVVWNGRDDNGKSVSSGIYFYKLKTNNFEKTKKMILMK